MARQRVEVIVGDRHDVFDAVLQKRGDELLMLVLTPFGTRAFVVVQRGTTVTVEGDVPAGLPFSPSIVMIEVQRVLFPPATTGGERMREVVRGGIRERHITRVDGRPSGEIVVRYEGDGTPPARATVEDPWSGLRLVITTSTVEHLNR